MYGYIYLTTNLLTNKIYIGQKKSDYFLGEEYLGSGKYLNHAIQKYGKENFSVELIDTADSRDELSEKEIFYITKYDATNRSIGYNISKGGIGGGEVHINNGQVNSFVSKKYLNDYLENGWVLGYLPGRKEINHSKTRAKNISKALKGRPKSQEHSKHHSEALRAKHMHWYTNGNVDQNLLIAEGEDIPEGYYRGKTVTEEFKKKCGVKNIGKTAWNKGLTKETDERVLKYANSIKATLNKDK